MALPDVTLALPEVTLTLLDVTLALPDVTFAQTDVVLKQLDQPNITLAHCVTCKMVCKPNVTLTVVTFKISRMFSLNLKPGIRLDIKKEQVKTHANLLKV